MEQAISLNRRASLLADQFAADAASLGAAVRTIGGARVIDCGIEAPGGFEAGRRFSEICMAGLGQVTLAPWQAGDLLFPGVQVTTEHPLTACLGSQYAGWAVKGEKFFAMGSGPARAQARTEKLYEHLQVADSADRVVLCLEGRQFPGEDAVAKVAQRCGVEPSQVTLLIAPTACVVGSVQVSARVVETALHKLHELGFDVGLIRAGWGVAPVPPVAKGDLEAIGRTNDCLLYGGRVHLTVDAGDDELAAIAPRVPACASLDYGRTFLELFRHYGDFYKIDPLLFSPAEVTLTSLKSGRSYSAGRLDLALLRSSLLEG